MNSMMSKSVVLQRRSLRWKLWKLPDALSPPLTLNTPEDGYLLICLRATLLEAHLQDLRG